MKLIPYLSFDGHAEEAMNFYADVFGGEIVQLDRYSSGQGMKIPEGYENKVLHGRVKFGENLIYFTDVNRKVVAGDQVSQSVEYDREDQIDRAYDKLSQGGTILMTLQKTFWGAKYGKLIDKFGIHWDLNYQYKSE